LELYAEVFEAAGALAQLQGFASFFGADFYGLPRNKRRIRLRRETWKIPDSYPFGNQRLVPLRAGETIPWRIAEGSFD
jgi:dihydroorotase